MTSGENEMYHSITRSILVAVVVISWIYSPASLADVFEYELVYTRFTNRLAENSGQSSITVEADSNNDGAVETRTVFAAVDEVNVRRVTYQWDDTSGILTQTIPPGDIANLPGADGILFAPDGDLVVGGQDNILYKIPADGSAIGNPGLIQSATGLPTTSFHVALDQNQQRVWTSDQPDGEITEVSLNFGSTITSHAVTGDEITQLSFAPPLTAVDSNLAYYSNSDSLGLGGSFGILDMTGGAGFTATQHISGQDGAHSIQYDPFTGDMLLFGDHTILQVDISGNVSDGDGPSSPTNPVLETTLDLSLVLDDVFGRAGVFAFGFFFGEETNRMDQGVVTGDGRLFAAVNTGHLIFIDYSSDGLLTGKSPFLEAGSGRIPFLDHELDDLAPIAGLGGDPGGTPIPEPASLTFFALATLALNRRRKQ
jgi:hypothetical protein